MNEFIQYLIQSSLCLSLLFLVYYIFLRNDTFFMVNRIYLLLATLFSLVIPLFHLPIKFGEGMTSFLVILDPVLITPSKISNLSIHHLNWLEILMVVYLTGVMIFTIRFVVQLVQLWILTRKNGITRKENANVVFVEEKFSPFSFFNLIYIRKEISQSEELRPIIDHELVHIRQRHSLDLLLVELLTIIQWFNPFAWLLQRSIKNLHEYLADEGVVRSGIAKHLYQQLIFDQTLGKQINNLTNNFHYSLIKKRFIMMTKTPSAQGAKLKVFLALPAIIVAILFFSAGNINPLQAQDKQAQKMNQASGDDKVFEKVEVAPEFPGGLSALYSFLGANIKYPEKAKKEGITGTVIVSFIIEKDGSVSHPTIKKSVGGGCDEASIKVVEAMPKWTPGKNKGKPVRVAFNLPIKYQLDKDAKKDQTDKK